MRSTLRALAHAQKSGDGVPAYTRWVNRPLGRGSAAVAHTWGISPNAVSLTGFALSFIGLVLIAFGPGHGFGYAAALLLVAGYALDSADGQLARLERRSSVRGEWFDHVLDSVRLPFMHVAVALGLMVAGHTTAAIAAVLLSVLVSADFFSQNLGGLLRDRTAPPTATAPSRRGTLQSWVLLPKDPGLLACMFALWERPVLFIPAYLVVMALNSGAALVASRRRWVELGAATKERS